MTMQMHFRKWPVVLGLSMFFWFAISTGAQTTPMQSPPPSNDNEQSNQDRDITRGELANFDKFLDSHREIADQVRKNPSLVDNQQFLKDHPALQAYVQQHPAVRASAVGVLVAIIAVFRAHECIRIFLQFFADLGVLLHISLQRWVVLQKLLVVDQRWVLTNLLGDFTVAVEELVEARQLPARNVAILIRPFIVIARGRALHGRGLRPCKAVEQEKHRQA